MNSTYGKMLEVLDCTNTFITDNFDDILSKSKISNYVSQKQMRGLIQLNNGQCEASFSLGEPTVRKPLQLGAFILSYARAHVNKLIREVGTENIYYGDTDSLYITKDAYNKVKDNPEFIGNGLGQYKNDYGDNININNAVFLDQKRYLLINDNKLLGEIKGYKSITSINPLEDPASLDSSI